MAGIRKTIREIIGLKLPRLSPYPRAVALAAALTMLLPDFTRAASPLVLTISIPYSLNVPSSLLKSMPPGCHTRFYGSIPAESGSQKLLVHLYEQGGVSRPIINNGIETNFHLEHCVLRVFRQSDQWHGKLTLLHSSTLTEEIGKGQAHVNFQTCRVFMTWLQPVLRQIPVLCLELSEPAYFGSESKLAILTFTNGMTQRPITQVFTQYAEASLNPTYQSYTFPADTDSRGFIRAKIVSGSSDSERTVYWVWNGNGYQPLK